MIGRASGRLRSPMPAGADDLTPVRRQDADREPMGRLAPRWLAAVMGLYRSGISPLLGPSCRYHPTCSHYAEQAIVAHGFVRGVWLGLGRILRCHPFARGGLDPVPAPARNPIRQPNRQLDSQRLRDDFDSSSPSPGPGVR